MSCIYTGKIKFYNEEKGFGFLVDDKTEEEYFFGSNQAKKIGLSSKDKGASVSYSLDYDREKMSYRVISLEF